ncbi:MAG TPA: hypothetical protein G4O04_02590 [Anaerolineae bacterium]|nr:hypothetical protein [Anaerolineae bacterium]
MPITLIWGLLVLLLFMVVLTLYRRLRAAEARYREELERIRKERLGRSRAALRGQVAERLAPWLPGFAYSPSDAHFLGDPVDYILFSGYADLRDGIGHPDSLEVVILDIKRGPNARLSATQKAIARAVEAGRVRFEVLRVSEEGIVQTLEWRKGKLRRKATPPLSSPAGSTAPGAKPNPRDAARKSHPDRHPPKKQERPARSGLPWDPREEAYLLRKIRQGASYETLADIVRRTPEEVRTHIEALLRREEPSVGGNGV